MSISFQLIDSIILFLYLVLILSVGLYSSGKKDRTTSDYFLAGRNVGWIAIGLSLFATNISSEHFIGLAGSGASRGLAVAHFELMAIFILIFLGWFLAPIYIKSGVITMPEFLGKRYDQKSRKIFTVTSVIIYIFTKITVTLFAGGLLFQKIFGLNIYTSAIIIILITGIYTVIGGGSAVIRTHVIQGILIILGALILTVFGLNHVGGFSGLTAKLPEHFFQMFKPINDPDFPWTGIIFGAPILAYWYWCTDQFIVQRILSARSVNDACRGSILAATLKITPIFILVLPGLIAVAIFPEVKGDEAYPTLLASNILPMGLKGVVVAGLLGAIMSSLASVFNSTASLFTNDFYKLKNPDSSERKLVLVGRLATTATVVIAIFCVPLVKVIANQVYVYLQSLQAYLSPPITAVFLFGLLSKKVNAKGAVWTLVIGELLGLSRLFIEMFVDSANVDNPIFLTFVKINYLHFAILLFVVSTVLIFTISYLTQSAAETRKSKTTYTLIENFKQIIVSRSSSMDGAANIKLNLTFSALLIFIIISIWGLLG